MNMLTDVGMRNRSATLQELEKLEHNLDSGDERHAWEFTQQLFSSSLY